jgi:uncharacterized protein (DUF2235 family)
MALYAFDGTWNKEKAGTEKDTNVARFCTAYQGRVEYQKGVGTRFGRGGQVVGGIAGAGGRSRVLSALRVLRQNFSAGDKTIDIVGFSRGAALALHFANQIFTDGIPRHRGSTIRFMGLWDTVPSFGVPGSKRNIGWDLDLPDNVDKCYHALALDERRLTFALHRPEARVTDANQEGRLFELWFRGVHSDVGGGNANPGLSSISLNWMFVNGAACGLGFDPVALDQARRQMDPDRPNSLHPSYSPKGLPFRIVRWNDRVHASVVFRSDKEHNNPPLNTVRIDDSGKEVGRFSRR